MTIGWQSETEGLIRILTGLQAMHPENGTVNMARYSLLQAVFVKSENDAFDGWYYVRNGCVAERPGDRSAKTAVAGGISEQTERLIFIRIQ